MSDLRKELKLSIILVLAIAAVAYLFTRPKFVVKKDSQITQNSKKEETHSLPDSVLNKLKSYKEANKAANSKAYYAGLGNIFAQASIFDSSAYYSEKISVLEPNLSNNLATADAYNQAFNLALDPVKIEAAAVKARAYYNLVIKAQPDNLYAKTNLASTYVKSETPMVAINTLKEVLDANPNYVPAIMSLGGLSMQSGQYDKAILRFQKVLNIDPVNINAKLGLAYSLLETKKIDEAKSIFNELLKGNLSPAIKEEIMNTLKSIK